MNPSDTLLTSHSETARNLFLNGCNCSQAVFTAFSDVTHLDKETASRISSPFGGGMGRMREVCGAFSAVLMVLGMLEGITQGEPPEAKKELYKKVQQLNEDFRRKNGSIICRELLNIPKAESSAEPSPRTAEYYKKRPCADIVAAAAAMLDEYLQK